MVRSGGGSILSDVSTRVGRRRIDQIGRRSLLEIALHESGHAIVAWITGRKIERLSMVTDDQFAKLRTGRVRAVRAGYIVLAPLPAGVDLHDPTYRVLAEREGMIAIAGNLAVLKFQGKGKKTLSKADLEGLSHIAAHAGASQGRLESELDRLVSRTSLYLDVYRSWVEALANSLLFHRELTGRQVTAFLRSRPAPPGG